MRYASMTWRPVNDIRWFSDDGTHSPNCLGSIVVAGWGNPLSEKMQWARLCTCLSLKSSATPTRCKVVLDAKGVCKSFIPVANSVVCPP